MKISLSKELIEAIGLLLFLSIGSFAGKAILANATVTKAPTIYINGSGFLELMWKSGKSQIYGSDSYASLGGLDSITIVASQGWHIDSLRVDGNLQTITDDDGFSITDVQANNNVSATFMTNDGEDDVVAGSYVTAYPYPNVGLVFDDVLANGVVYAYAIGLEPPSARGESWNVWTTANFNQSVTVILVLSLSSLGDTDPATLRLLRTEIELARADVNEDGYVNGTDVSIVANASPSTPGIPKYDPRLDLNNDGVINDEDVNIANNYIGENVWTDITSQVIVESDKGLVYVYGVTDHFSVFGVR